MRQSPYLCRKFPQKMSNSIFTAPIAVNEPVKTYAPGNPERKALQAELKRMIGEVKDIPMFIGGREIREGERREIRPPHDHKKVVGHYYRSTQAHVNQAIDAALKAKAAWADMAYEDRAAIFL